MTDTESSERLIERARMLCQLKRYDEAAAAARQAIAVTPSDADAWCLLAQALWAGDDAPGALDAASRAAAIAPEHEWPHRLRSLALSSLHRHDEALAAALEAVRIAPFAWHTHARVAISSSALDYHDQAERAAAKAIELAADDAGAWVVAGHVAAAAKNRKLAEFRYHEALRIDPQNSAAHNGIGRLHMTRRGVGASGLAAAASGFATAVRADPRDRHSRAAIDLVLRVFLARAAYVIFLLAYVVARTATGSPGAAARLIPVALLAVPGLFVWHFVAKLSRDMRAYLLRTLRHGLVAVATVAEMAAVACILGAAFTPQGQRTPLLFMAIAAALAGRLTLMAEIRRRIPVPGRWSAATRRVLWVSDVAIALFGGLLIASTVVVAGAIFLAAALALAFGLWRTRPTIARAAS